ncbi:MAG: Rab family GTPase [Candidatus Hodarchaeota archaeon]
MLGDPKSEKKEAELQFKIILLGDQAVGKTALVQRYVKHTFGGKYLPTLGLDVSIKYLEINGESPKSVRLHIYDIAGQDMFRKLRSRYFHGAQGVIFAYDVTRQETLSHLENWLNEQISAVGPLPFTLLGNKIDLVTEFPQESTPDYLPSNLQEQIKGGLGSGWFATSAKTGTNVQEAFETLLRLILSSKNIQEEEENITSGLPLESWQMEKIDLHTDE